MRKKLYAKMTVVSSRIESTIDYPGKLSQVLFTSGCNFRCKFCHNPELIQIKNKGIDVDEILKGLKSKAESGWCEGICISGGEPTINKDLPEIIKKIKKMNLAVKLDTNGTNPEMLKFLLENKLVDYVAMDIKSRKEKYPEIVGEVEIEKIEESIELVKNFPDYEFRTTVLPFFIDEDLEEIGKWISKNGKVKRFTLQQFHREKTLAPEYGKLFPKSKEEIKELGEIMRKYAEEVVVHDY